MSKSRKSVWLFGALCTGALCAFFFGKTLCWMGIEHYAHKLDPKATVTAESMTFGRKGLALRHVVFDGAFGHVDIEEMHVGLRVFLRKLSIKASLSLSSPSWQVPEHIAKKETPASAALRLHLDVQDAKLIRGDHTLTASFKSGSSKEDLGLLELADGSIEVMFKQLSLGLTAIGRFHHADLKKLAPFGDLFPTSWLPEEGMLAGHLTAQWSPDGSLTDVGGDFTARELSLWHPKRKLQFGAKNLQWEGDFPTGTLKVDDGYLLALSKRLPAQWGLRLSGGVERGKIALTGCMVREGEFFPIAIVGDGKIGKDTALQTTFHISGEGSTTLAFNLKPTQSILRGVFKDISSKQLLLFRDGLGAFFPMFQDLELEGQNLSAEMTAFLKNGKLESVEADKITAETMYLKWPSHQIEAEGKNLNLTGSLPFDNGPKWKKAAWNFSIDQGKILDFENLAACLCVDGENIQNGRASSKWHGFEIEGEASGTLFSPQISLNAWGTTEKLAGFIQAPLKNNEPLALRALIDRKNRQFSCVGNLKTGDGEVTFGSSFDLKKEIPKGWVEAENISADLYQLALKPFNLAFTLDGQMSASGTFSSAGCDLSISSPLLHFSSNELEIDVPHLDKHAHILSPAIQHAVVQYQTKTKKWEISVPLFGAKLKDKTHGIEVEGIEGLAVLDGKNIFAKDLKANVHGLDVCMHVSVEMKEQNQADLHISATEVAGDITSVMDILRKFDKFETLNLPLTGHVQNIDQSPFSLYAPLQQEGKTSAYSARLKLTDGSYAITEEFVGKALSCEMKYSSSDEILEVHALDGEIELTSGDELFEFELNAPHLRLLDMDKGDWEFDFRIERQTHDLMRFSGALDHEKGLYLDEKQSHLFGGSLQIETLQFAPFALNAHTQLKLQKMGVGLRFLNALHLVNIDQKTLKLVDKAELGGRLDVDVNYSGENFNLELGGKDFKIKQRVIPKFSAKIDCEQNLVSLDHLVIGNFEARGLAAKQDQIWDVSLFEIDWDQTQLQTFEGHFSDHLLTLILNRAQVDLGQLRPLFFEEKNRYFQGLFDVAGNLTLDLASWDLTGQFQFESEDFTAAKMDLKTQAPFEVEYSLEKGLCVRGALLELAGNEMQIEQLGYLKKDAHWSCAGLTLSWTPEIVHFLAENGLIPYVETQAQELLIRGIPFAWDNHLETTIDLCYSPKSFTLSAKLKDGYYWIGDISCYLKDGIFIGRNTGVTFDAKSTLNHADFTVQAKLPFDRTLDPCLTLNDHSEFSAKPLEITFSRDSKAVIRHAVGSFCGFDINFHHNPSLQSSKHLGLTGDVNIDWSLAAKILPSDLSGPIQDYDIGRGYKLTGDLLLDVASPKHSSFKGFFKGKNFELLGYKFKNMLSSIDYSGNYFLFQDFSLADEALALQIPHINVAGKNLSIPTLKIQELRPSLLQKCGKLPGRLKPFVIKNLEFHKIAGTLGDRKSFSGKGHLDFINTFKRDMGLLDIPKELFSRIGLDTGLLIPVRGELDCTLNGSRIHFTKLSNTYSEGERSQFFLSKKQPAYLDLDGQININIRMKQYVLLKVTQPFVLSIRGTLDHPKFSLQ